jgi:hypothetical protein
MGQLPDKDIQEKFQQQKNDVEAKFFVWFYINYGLESIIKILYIYKKKMMLKDKILMKKS